MNQKKLGNGFSMSSTRLNLIAMVVIALIAPFFVSYLGGAYWVRVIDFALLYVMLALGLNIMVGLSGMLNLGYIAFYAIGAYTAALLSSSQLTNISWIAHIAPHGLNFPFWAVLLISVIVTAIAATIIVMPTLHLRGDYLAIVTLGFGELVRIFINNLDAPVNITNGPQGISNINPIKIGGFNFAESHHFLGVNFTTEYQYYYLFLLFVVVMAAFCLRMQYSYFGRALVAIREDEVAARAMGINVRQMKLLAFVLGACFGGVAGVLFSSFQGFVSPESFTFWESIVVLICVVLGGMGHVAGVILGAIIISIFPEFLRSVIMPLQDILFGHELISAPVLRQLLYGSAMVLIMIFNPNGLWPLPSNEKKLKSNHLKKQCAVGGNEK